MKSNKGFTLTELIITLSIISILAIIAVPAYLGQQKGSTRTEAYNNLSALRLMEETFFSDFADYSATAADTVAVKGIFPGFTPGPDPQFKYELIHDNEITTIAPLAYGVSAAPPCFTAVATGLAGSRVAGETFAIDCRYNKNF